MRRSKLSKKTSRKMFKNTAGRENVHAKNFKVSVMRGGIRL